MTQRSDLPEIKQALKDRILDLCRALLPDGRAIGRLYVANNPITGDHAKTPELKVALNRDTGAWIDYRSGEKGDVIRLIEYCRATDFPGAMSFARDFLGIRTMSIDERRRFAEDAARRAEQAATQAVKDTAYQRRAGEKLFHEALLDGAGSAAEAHARAYFEARACPLDRVPNRDRATMRFSAGTEYWRGASFRRDEQGRPMKTAAGPFFPAIHSAMRGPLGQVTACHVTFLDPIEPVKAPVDGTAKLMRGEAKGAVIRIAHGPEGLPPEEAREKHPLILCEGIEDGLSLAIALPEARVWAAGSLVAMASAPVAIPCVSAVIVAGDNDWQSPQAQKQLESVLRQLAAAGKPLSLMQSHAGKDFNDLMKGE